MSKLNNKNKTIILAAGGTGGHLSPALAIAAIMSNKGNKVILYTDQRCKNYLPKESVYEIIIQKNYRISKNPIKLGMFFLSLAKNTCLIVKKIYSEKVDIVISFGGYSSFSANLSSIITFKKLIIHEQNSVLGRQNKFFLKFAKYIAYSFPDTKKLEKISSNKKVNTGIPVRSNFVNKAITSSKLPKNNKFTILVMGGSQGASFLGENIAKIFSTIDKGILSHLRIIHQVRKEHLNQVIKIYEESEIDSEVKTYFSDINTKFSDTDLIISRAGAATISEVIFAKKPSILIPYPTAKDNHQYYNAKYLGDNNAAIIFQEKGFIEEKLKAEILKFIQDPEFKEEIEKNIENISEFSDSKRFIELIESI